MRCGPHRLCLRPSGIRGPGTKLVSPGKRRAEGRNGVHAYLQNHKNLQRLDNQQSHKNLLKNKLQISQAAVTQEPARWKYK